MSEQDILTTGMVVEDRFRLVSEGSRQDLGMAYTAYDLQEDRLVSLRVVATRWGSGQEALTRLQLAEQPVADLHAPGLIPYEHTGLVGRQLYLVHTHSQEQTLADLLAQQVRLDVDTAVELSIELCEALAPAHRAGLTHGSLSPHCVLVKDTLGPDGTSKAKVTVLDTGLFPALRPADTTTQEPWGRLPYISPEQASGLGVHPSSDVYVIGAILYEMLIGRPPFRAVEETVVAQQHLRQEPPSLQIMDTSIPRPLAQIVYSALAKEPSSRYRNAGQLAHILRAQAGAPPMVRLQPQPGAQSQVEPPVQVRPQPPVEPLSQPGRPVRQESLVVPPPPTPIVGDTWSSTEAYGLEGNGNWQQRPTREGADWVMIALLIAALIAVLGLIPLWRAVYNRYVVGSASSYLAPHRLETALAPELLGDGFQGCQAQREPLRGAELGESEFVWYNTVPSGPSLARLHPTRLQTRHLIECRETHSGFWSPAYG